MFVPLKTAAEETFSRVGHKAAMLARIQGSVSVPFSLVITDKVFTEFVRYNDLGPELSMVLQHTTGDAHDLVQGFERIAKKFENATFPPNVLSSLKECYELVSLDTKNLDILSSSRKKHSVLLIRRSTSYPDYDLTCTGTTYANEKFEEFLNSLKKSYLSIFSPSSVAYRMKNNIREFSIALIVSRLPNIYNCYEASFSKIRKTLNVLSYQGFFDMSRTVMRDSFVLSVEFLKIIDTKIQPQETVAIYDIQKNNVVLTQYTSGGSSQSAPDQTILEVGRLSKKIRSILDLDEFRIDFTSDKEGELHCVDVWVSTLAQSLPDIDVGTEKLIEKVQSESETLNIDVKTELNDKETQELIRTLQGILKKSGEPSAEIILRSLENPNKEAILQALSSVKEIISRWTV